MDKHDIDVIERLYKRVKKELLLKQVRYELHGVNTTVQFNLIDDPEYRDFVELLHLVSDVGDLLRSLKPRERRNNDQQVFEDRRD